ncbi:hypothetical protein MRB53_008747 [Persea americana]|uniref:Uncharacterized protein n=1 Tax=Persea americana TaxID=3435 RepID=A0ACC2LM74_PERAE|nr:hypothetical protein MRB53_008747 [Persea americana]
MVSNHPWVTDDQSIVPKPTFFFGDAVPDDSTYQRRCFQFSYTVDGEKRTVSTRSTFDRTISIMSLSSTCSKKEDPPSWVNRTNVIKPGFLLAALLVLQRSRLPESRTYHILQVSGATLKEAEIFDAVRAFRQTVVFSDEAFMAMLESFLPQTNTFVVTNGEIGFSLKELRAITRLPILSNLYEEFMPIDSVLEEQSEEFRLLYFQLVAFYDFLKEKEGSKVRCSSWRSGSFLSSNFFDSGESSESTTQEVRAKNSDSKKISAIRENLKELFTSTDAIHSDTVLRRDLTVYLTYWLGEAIFAGGDGTHIRPHCIFPACQMAFGVRLALVPALYSYLCTKLHAVAFLVRLGLPMNRDDDPFMIRLDRGKLVSESLLSVRLRIRRFWDVEMGQSSVKLSPGLRKKAFDFGVSLDPTRVGSGRHYSLTNAERSWLFNICVGTMVYRRHLFVDIQSYVPSRFAMQLGFSQGVVRAPSSKVKCFGGLQDGRNAWAFCSTEDTTAMISYPELPTLRTAGSTKWFIESFSAYRGLSKKELDVKQSSGKGLRKSDGVRREEVMAFLFGDKHRTGFLEDQDVIRSGAAQEIPDEVLEQLAEEEAEVAAWIQAEWAKASMESTGKSKPSSEDSGEMLYFDGGACTSSNSSQDDGMMMPKVPADEEVTDPIVASEEEPRDSKVDPESSPGCEVTEEVPLSFSEPERGVPAADPGVGASSTSFDEAEASPRADIPSPVAPIGKSFLLTLPTVPDMGSRQIEHGEFSSEPSRQFARKVLKRVLSSWVETLSSGHLEAGFGMVKHVQNILADSEEVGLDITDAKAFVDKVITLGNKWTETKSFPNDDFFNEMFLKPSSEVNFELNEILRTRKQLVQEKNVTELAIIELTQDQYRLDREVTEARQRLELLEEQAAAKWAATLKARDRERTLICQVEEVESNLRRKTQEYEQWQILWEELPHAEDESRRHTAFYGKILKKRGLEALEAKAKSLLKELSVWLKTMSD